jgi:hypothetical protein
MGKTRNGGRSQNVRQEQLWPHPSPPYLVSSQHLGKALPYIYGQLHAI